MRRSSDCPIWESRVHRSVRYSGREAYAIFAPEMEWLTALVVPTVSSSEQKRCANTQQTMNKLIASHLIIYCSRGKGGIAAASNWNLAAQHTHTHTRSLYALHARDDGEKKKKTACASKHVRTHVNVMRACVCVYVLCSVGKPHNAAVVVGQSQNPHAITHTHTHDFLYVSYIRSNDHKNRRTLK